MNDFNDVHDYRRGSFKEELSERIFREGPLEAHPEALNFAILFARPDRLTSEFLAKLVDNGRWGAVEMMFMRLAEVTDGRARLKSMLIALKQHMGVPCKTLRFAEFKATSR